MTLRFTAQDGEFVTSTGSNATSSGGTTPFDGAPAASSGLVITPPEGDPEPRLFELGDTYDLAWDGGRIQDAIVVRSDAAPGKAGIVGFQGTDQDGNLAYVLWTPDFDLQSWYDTATSGGGSARFYTSDRQANYTHGYVCFASEVRITTPYGRIPVGGVQVGDRVLTLDRGFRAVRWIGRRRVIGYDGAAPVLCAPGSIGNDAPLRMSQQHRVLWRSARAELLFGEEEVLVPAKALVGLRGVSLAPCDSVSYVHLLLDRHEVLCAEGADCESLFVGPVAEGLLGQSWLLPDGEESAIRHHTTVRPVLTYREARLLLGFRNELGQMAYV